jgi:hypothetical protein
MARFGPWTSRERTTAFLLALSYHPFLFETWLGGNVTVIPFVALSAAVIMDDAKHPFLSGLALTVCLNKPSLLVLILPMLLVTRRFKILAGFGAGTAVLVSTSALVLGIRVWWDFIHALAWWAQVSRTAPGFFRDWKYVDLNASFRMLPGGHSWLGLLAMIVVALWALAGLLRTSLAVARSGREVACLTWAVTITWTLLLNAYVPVYDCTLLVVAGVLAAAALRDPVSGSLPPDFQTIVALFYLTAWITQPFARLLGVQAYTVVLLYAGLWLLSQIHRLLALPLAAHR